MIPSTLNSNLVLKKKNGEIVQDVQGFVSPESIIIEDLNLVIDEGDIFSRVLPNQKIEDFEVTSISFNNMPKPGFYRIKYRKNLQAMEKNVHPTTIIHANNSRIYSNSIDNSVSFDITNIVENFAKLEELIQANITDDKEKKTIVESIEQLKQSVNSPNYITRYKEFIYVAQKHISIVAPFLPYLSSLLK